MTQQNPQLPAQITSIEALAKLTDYSLMDRLTCDPAATADGDDYNPRQVFSGHYVPVKPTPIAAPAYVAHSETLFKELNFDQALAHSDDFRRLFSGDVSQAPAPMRKVGWATGYALSIFGTEYTQQCPFGTGNGYGDGRAVSVLEMVTNQQRWEMQLKGGGRTPYCRGADGRAVLRSSIREFLAQEHMHALGVPTSRSLSLFVSTMESVYRPWYSEGARAFDPDVMMPEPVAISTRVAPSFLRVGQIELFGRRARHNEYQQSLEELEQIVLHLIEREYKSEIDAHTSTADKLLALASAFSERLSSLVTEWLRVGYCQGNFNSDNCAAGGFTLDYGPFGFVERFDPYFQPWTGGGEHFSLFNQPVAAARNFHMFCTALRPLLQDQPPMLEKLDAVDHNFLAILQQKLNHMWASKLGLETFDAELFGDLLSLMIKTPVDYNLFFRELSHIPDTVDSLARCFYEEPTATLQQQWSQWLQRWQALAFATQDKQQVSGQMKRVNPKYTWREWLVVPAYQQARQGDYSLVRELQEVLTHPYDEQSRDIEDKYYQLRPKAYFQAGGVSHYSCSS